MWPEALLVAVFLGSIAVGLARRQRTAPEHAAHQPTRRRLLDAVRRRPGARLSELWKALGISRNSARYHLFVLERIGAIEALGDSTATWYFPPDTPHAAELAVLRRGRVLYVAKSVARRPGLSQAELLDLLAMSRKVFRDYADLLVESDLMTERRQWRTRAYYPTARLNDILDRLERAPSHDPEVRPDD